ncbi:MAG: ASPIC/UnbV domain-containing protein, partial [Acidobacteriota bacterium]
RADAELGFFDVTTASRLAGPSLPLTGFGAVFGDFDLDGDLDLAAAHGGVTRGSRPGDGEAGTLARDYGQPTLFFEQRRGRFHPVPVEVEADVGRALARGDLDGDGDLDLVASHSGGPPRLYLAPGEPRRPWLQVDARRAGGGVAEHAHIALHDGGVRQVRLVARGQSYLTSHSPIAHFGLGDGAAGRAGRVERVEVRWPGGGVTAVLDVPPNRRLRVVEP